MANSYLDETQQDTSQRSYRATLLGVAVVGSVLLLAGFGLAALMPGVAQPSTGAAFVLALALALLVGVSKTSSA